MTPIRLALALALAAAPALAQEPDLERGQELAERWCADCHLVGPAGPGGDAAPAFEWLARNRTDEALKTWMADPHPPMPKLDISAMAADDITAYIRSLAACTISC